MEPQTVFSHQTLLLYSVLHSFLSLFSWCLLKLACKSADKVINNYRTNKLCKKQKCCFNHKHNLVICLKLRFGFIAHTPSLYFLGRPSEFPGKFRKKSEFILGGHDFKNTPAFRVVAMASLHHWLSRRRPNAIPHFRLLKFGVIGCIFSQG